MPAKEISSTKKLRDERLKLSERVRSDLLKPSNELRRELLKLPEAVKLYGVLVVPPDERVQVHLQKAERYSMQVRSALKRLNIELLEPSSKKVVASASSTWIDPDDAPEWTKEDFERADLYHGDKLIRAAVRRPMIPSRRSSCASIPTWSSISARPGQAGRRASTRRCAEPPNCPGARPGRTERRGGEGQMAVTRTHFAYRLRVV